MDHKTFLLKKDLPYHHQCDDPNCDTIYYYRHYYLDSKIYPDNNVYVGIILYHKRSVELGCKDGLCFNKDSFPSCRKFYSGRLFGPGLCESAFTIELDSIHLCKRDDILVNFMFNWDRISSL